MKSEASNGQLEQMKPGTGHAGEPDFRVSNEDMKAFLEALKRSKPEQSERIETPIIELPALSSPEELPESRTKHAPRFRPLIFKEPDEKPCVLGLWPGEGNKIVFSGKGCEYHIVPMTPIERELQQKRREYEATPAYKKEQEEHRLWVLRHTVD